MVEGAGFMEDLGFNFVIHHIGMMCEEGSSRQVIGLLGSGILNVTPIIEDAWPITK